MITPINIALLGVVLAAVALVILRRRRSGAANEAVSDEMPLETMTPLDEPAAREAPAPSDDVFSKHIWAETAATMSPIREAEAEPALDADLDAVAEAEGDSWAEAEPALDADLAAVAEADGDSWAADEPDEVDDESEDDDERRAHPEGEYDQDTGEIQDLELELEAMDEPDDGLGDIITEPGWYLPGETDMTRGSPGAQTGLLVPVHEPTITGGPLDEAMEPEAEALPAPLPEVGNDFSATTGWAAPEENGAEPVEPSWLGLADEEAAATAAVEAEASFEVTPSPSDDLFELPPLDEGVSAAPPELGNPSALPLAHWQEPVTPSPSFALGGAPAETTVSQHGPLTVSIDPAALLAIETEATERSTSRADGDVSWELTLKVELRQRAKAPDEAA